MNRIAYVAAALGLALGACRGGGDDTSSGDDVVTPDSPPVVGGDVTIQKVQSDDMAVGTQIELRGVVVTAIDTYGARTGDIWVGEPEGGEFSGVKVFKAPLAVVATLAVGDLIDITNIAKDEFALNTDPTGRKVTEVGPVGGGEMTITKVGTGTLPTPATVDAKAIAALADEAARDAEWEKWEGVRIKVINAAQLTGDAPFGTADDQHSFNITGGAKVESVLSAFNTDAVVGACFGGITGIGDYFFDYLVLPENEAATAGGGAGCDAVATNTVAEVQMGTVTGDVNFANVIITARDDVPNNKGIWVADAAQGAAYNGVYVYTGSSIDASWVVGASVSIQGKTSEFDVSPAAGDSLTEIKNATITVVNATAGTPVPATGTTTAELGDITNGEKWEGVLVKVSDVKVTAVNGSKVELTDNSNTKIMMYNDAFDFPAVTNGTCYASVTGLMTVQLTDNVRGIAPRSAADMVAGSNCN